jgi:hypothetical protein
MERLPVKGGSTRKTAARADISRRPAPPLTPSRPVLGCKNGHHQKLSRTACSRTCRTTGPTTGAAPRLLSRSPSTSESLRRKARHPPPAHPSVLGCTCPSLWATSGRPGRHRKEAGRNRWGRTPSTTRRNRKRTRVSPRRRMTAPRRRHWGSSRCSHGAFEDTSLAIPGACCRTHFTSVDHVAYSAGMHFRLPICQRPFRDVTAISPAPHRGAQRSRPFT